jgi:nucleoside-diphosphate-sugar epimerase
MTILVAGASGATGRLLVEQLLNHGLHVKIIVRSPDKLPEYIKNHDRLTVIHASILDLKDDELTLHVKESAAVVSCLGHELSFKGLFGQPRRLVTDATRRLCNTIRTTEPEKPVKFILMNTAGNSNRDLEEKISIGQRLVIGILRLLLPPHSDNEKAADYLRTEIGQSNNAIEWIAVRPDTLIDDDKVTAYELHQSPTRSALFNPGNTSRINVAHFIANLITDDDLWKTWKGQMPVIYNTTLA